MDIVLNIHASEKDTEVTVKSFESDVSVFGCKGEIMRLKTEGPKKLSEEGVFRAVGFFFQDNGLSDRWALEPMGHVPEFGNDGLSPLVWQNKTFEDFTLGSGKL